MCRARPAAHGEVFWPMTGEVAARVALANAADVNTVVENAKAAQPAWGATNPQRRARVLMKFLDLANADLDNLTDLLAREHGKVLADAKGRYPARAGSRGIFARRAADDEGRIHRRRRAGHRRLFHTSAARRRRGYHAVQFPGDDPDVEIRPRHRVRQRLHSETLRARSRRAAPPRRTDDRGRIAAGHSERRQRR